MSGDRADLWGKAVTFELARLGPRDAMLNFSRPPTSMTLHEFIDGKTTLAMNLERMEQISRDRTSLTRAD
jgi:hypothetical protein